MENPDWKAPPPQNPDQAFLPPHTDPPNPNVNVGFIAPPPNSAAFDPPNPASKQIQSNPEVQPMKNDSTQFGKQFEYGQDEYRDKKWIIIFLIHLTVFIFFGLINVANFWKKPSGDAAATSPAAGAIIAVMLIAAAIGVLFGVLWMKVMSTVSLETLLYVYAGVTIGFGLVFLFTGAFFSGVIIILLGIFIGIWIQCCARRSIPFATAMIKPTCAAIQENKKVISLSLVLGLFQSIWAIGWVIFAISILKAVDPNLERKSTLVDVLYFILLISFYWTSEVIKNVGHVTISGVISSWWLVPDHPSPFSGALKRALTTSFGSICFGSLVVAVLKAIRAILRQAQRNARDSDNIAAVVLLCIADCCLSWIESLIEYFNVYAYTHVAIYGTDYITSAKNTWSLFKGTGFSMIINDNIIGMVITLGVLLAGCVTSGATALIVLFDPLAVLPWYMVFIAFLIGLVTCSLVLNSITSGIATAFVLWAESPDLIKSTRPNFFAEIIRAKQARYDDDM